MNSLKTVLVVVVLALVAGAVYVLINNNTSTSMPPPEAADGWSSPPNVQVPDAATSESPFESRGMGVSAGPSMASSGGLAPPFVPDQGPSEAWGGGAAPPFSPEENAKDDFAGRAPLPEGRSEAPLPSDRVETIDPPLPGPGPSEVSKAFAHFIEAAHEELQQGNLTKVHQELSVWYKNPQLTSEESRQLVDLLDQLAGTVVYSRQHLLERPYTVQSGDTLPRIARSYGVPWQLLAKINGISDPENLQVGQQLKVVRGPFDAEIDLDRRELTLKLRGLYAGRFPVGIGPDQGDLEGTYFVEDKIDQSDDPNNPLGRYWIKLNDRIGIHGTNDLRNLGASGTPGSICLGDQDIEDIHAILSIGSRVQILR